MNVKAGGLKIKEVLGDVENFRKENQCTEGLVPCVLEVILV